MYAMALLGQPRRPPKGSAPTRAEPFHFFVLPIQGSFLLKFLKTEGFSTSAQLVGK
jgi:hypothetical protein